MELPQQRTLGTEGRKATHDFLSLYSHSTVQQDPRPPSQGGCLKTLDFLQPLERGGKTTAKEETNFEISTVEKQPPPVPPPPSAEHVLPGGIGTYSISHISYFNQREDPKPEGSLFTVAQASSSDKNDENSNCSSYTGSGFTLWDESAPKKGKTGKENVGERPNIVRETAAKTGQWTTSERPSQPLLNNHRSNFSCFSSSQPSEQKSQSFMEMIKSARGSTQDADLYDDEEFVLKKESPSPVRKELRVEVNGKNVDQKANTPRSKHSATEQRRRSKINDRFQMLRELIPHSDQKRDKASFLLEVIEYIQFLQGKVQKYEGSYQGWDPEPAKLVPWRNNNRPAESYVNQPSGIHIGSGPALLFPAKLEDKNMSMPPTIPGSAQNLVESDISPTTTFKAMDHHPATTDKAMPFPMSVQPNFFNARRNGSAVTHRPPRLASDAENVASLPQNHHLTTDGTDASDKLKQQELSIEGGTMSISSVYSQGLLSTLTKALQTSGVDLSRTSVSVQIELGKGSNIRSISPASIFKDNEVPSQGTTWSKFAGGKESKQARKRLKASPS